MEKKAISDTTPRAIENMPSISRRTERVCCIKILSLSSRYYDIETCRNQEPTEKAENESYAIVGGIDAHNHSNPQREYYDADPRPRLLQSLLSQLSSSSRSSEGLNH